ncbi:MAG: transketolase C-terminal domain-containing protein, partial [Candidatus Subteraquimicrobiales bacterium]|nr:transketolase C-terminal domain-containing protein [Candidatus Subteraquimicrobiales bacterium]
AEQSMMGTAAGLATTGKVSYTGSFAIFASQRALEIVRNVISYSNLNVKLCPTHAGITVGADGSSHQTVEDIAIMRAIPNMKVIVPADYVEAKSAIKAAYHIEGPFYIRLGRAPLNILFDETYQFELGKAVKLTEGRDATILATGIMVEASLRAANLLKEEGIEAEVINVSTLKPLDSKTILLSAKKTKAVVTAEEHSVIGGLGGAVAELLVENLPLPLKRVGIKDQFGQSGNPEELLQHYGLTSADIISSVRQVLDEKA